MFLCVTHDAAATLLTRLSTLAREAITFQKIIQRNILKKREIIHDSTDKTQKYDWYPTTYKKKILNPVLDKIQRFYNVNKVDLCVSLILIVGCH